RELLNSSRSELELRVRARGSGAELRGNPQQLLALEEVEAQANGRAGRPVPWHGGEYALDEASIETRLLDRMIAEETQHLSRQHLTWPASDVVERECER